MTFVFSCAHIVKKVINSSCHVLLCVCVFVWAWCLCLDGANRGVEYFLERKKITILSTKIVCLFLFFHFYFLFSKHLCAGMMNDKQDAYLREIFDLWTSRKEQQQKEKDDSSKGKEKKSRDQGQEFHKAATEELKPRGIQAFFVVFCCFLNNLFVGLKKKEKGKSNPKMLPTKAFDMWFVESPQLTPPDHSGSAHPNLNSNWNKMVKPDYPKLIW